MKIKHWIKVRIKFIYTSDATICDIGLISPYITGVDFHGEKVLEERERLL